MKFEHGVTPLPAASEGCTLNSVSLSGIHSSHRPFVNFWRNFTVFALPLTLGNCEVQECGVRKCESYASTSLRKVLGGYKSGNFSPERKPFFLHYPQDFYANSLVDFYLYPLLVYSPYSTWLQDSTHYHYICITLDT